MPTYVYAPETNQLDGIMYPMNPLMGYRDAREGWTPAQGAWYMAGYGVEHADPEGWNPAQGTWYLQGIDDQMSPMIRSDVATPTVDIKDASSQFTMPALNGGLGAVADALSVLSVVDLLTRP